MRRAASPLFALYALSMPVYCLARLAGQARWTQIATVLTLASWLACVSAHCVATRGLRRAAALWITGFAIALGAEYVGVTGGWLFGRYSYTDALGPKLFGAVPAVIPLAWLAMLYPAWVCAGILRPSTALRGGVLRVALAALAVTAWDLSLDPRMVADNAWVWHGGGAYFGVPPGNFAGWFATACVIFGFWTLIDRGPHIQADARLPVYVYGLTWLGESLANILFWGGLPVGAIVFVAMGCVAVPAWRGVTLGDT